MEFNQRTHFMQHKICAIRQKVQHHPISATASTAKAKGRFMETKLDPHTSVEKIFIIFKLCQPVQTLAELQLGLELHAAQSPCGVR